MRCSTAVGTLSSKRELFDTIDGEKFFKTEIDIEGSVFPVVGSEYILRSLEGKVQIEYNLKSQTVEKRLFTHINLATAIKVDESTEDVNSILVYGQVVKCNPLAARGDSGQNVLSFTVKYRSHDKNKNYNHCVAYNALARRLTELAMGDTIRFKGKLKIRKCIEVIVDEVVEIKPLNKGAKVNAI